MCRMDGERCLHVGLKTPETCIRVQNHPETHPINSYGFRGVIRGLLQLKALYCQTQSKHVWPNQAILKAYQVIFL